MIYVVGKHENPVKVWVYIIFQISVFVLDHAMDEDKDAFGVL